MTHQYYFGDSSFSNSSENHDFRLEHFENRMGENVTGSGFDKQWERRVAGQSLVFDAIFVTYGITGMYERTYTNFSNQDGIFIDGAKERRDSLLMIYRTRGRFGQTTNCLSH